MSVALLTSAAGTDLADLDEPALVARAVTRDSAAFGQLYGRYCDEVRSGLRRRLRNFPADVDDVASQVFMTAWEQIPSYQDRGRPFSAWLHTIARFKALEHINWRRSRREDELAEPTFAGGDVMAQRGLNPEDEAILHLELQRMLRSLSARRRLALVLRDWAGWSYDDVARALNVSHRAADRVITSARKAAREAALSQQPVTDRTTCECGCGRPVADSANGSRRFATQECWRQIVNERRRAPRVVRREAA